MSATAADLTPTGWAGGSQVSVPGIGVGRIILDQPRVIEIELPAPECMIVEVDDPRGPRSIVLVDPRVPWPKTVRVITAARLLEESAAAALLEDRPLDPAVGYDGAEQLRPHGRHLHLVRDEKAMTGR